MLVFALQVLYRDGKVLVFVLQQVLGKCLAVLCRHGNVHVFALHVLCRDGKVLIFVSQQVLGNCCREMGEYGT